MVLRVRRGSVETLVEGKAALARLYRTRRVASEDLVWHPAKQCWMPVAAFLFLDPDGAPGLNRSTAFGAAHHLQSIEGEPEMR